MRLHIAVSFCGVEHLGNSGHMLLFFLSLSCLLVFSDQLRAPVGPTPPRKVSLVESMGQEVRLTQADLSNCSLPVGAAPLPMQVPLTRAASYPVGALSGVAWGAPFTSTFIYGFQSAEGNLLDRKCDYIVADR